MSHYYDKNPTVKSDKILINYKVKNIDFKFYTDSGVFSKNKVDFGTNLLINSFENNNNGNVLDLCSGYGVVGIVINKLYNRDVYQTDINIRAVNLNKENNILNSTNTTIYNGDMFENISDIIFSDILLNPPIRAGKKIVYSLYLESFNHLKTNGSLYVVIQKKQGFESSYKYLSSIFKKIDVINKNKGYYIIKAVKLC